MFVDDLIFELLGVFLHEATRMLWVFEGIANALGQQFFELRNSLFTQFALGNNCTEWQRQICLALSQLSEVGYKLEVTTLIDKASLVNQHSRIGFTTLYSLGNL